MAKKKAKKKASKKSMPKRTGKGNEGKSGNGAKARAAIKTLQRKGYSNAEISSMCMGQGRKAGTISDIASGEIKNPPNDFTASLVRCAKSRPIKKKKK